MTSLTEKLYIEERTQYYLDRGFMVTEALLKAKSDFKLNSTKIPHNSEELDDDSWYHSEE